MGQYNSKEYDPEKHDAYKALSVKQPYAGYIANGEKTIEVRSKPTTYRGQLLICASKSGQPEKGAPGYGCALAIVYLYDCKHTSMLTEEEWKQTKLPPHSVNGYAWFIRLGRKVNPKPVRGQLGIFNLIYTKGEIYQPITEVKLKR